ncbi:hypothetical protein AYI68_g4774 [Smittium mucronatum]|uniref:DMAP1-binding domain-containing protein n=1 Tax=Smittium mucronatum TaxID=133383 RepID=A0A1R0GW81_9FUNG|nr:hypothetical protein AYI68_g4774 [Smittium mucronatum]
MDNHDEFPELSEQYLSKLNDLIQEYQNGYLTEIGYEKKKEEITLLYNQQIEQASLQKVKLEDIKKDEDQSCNMQRSDSKALVSQNSSPLVSETSEMQKMTYENKDSHKSRLSNIPQPFDSSNKNIKDLEPFELHSTSSSSTPDDVISNSKVVSPELLQNKEFLQKDPIDSSSPYELLTDKNAFDYLSDSSADSYFLDKLSIAHSSNNNLVSNNSLNVVATRSKSIKKSQTSLVQRQNSLLNPKTRSIKKRSLKSNNKRSIISPNRQKNLKQINAILGNFNEDDSSDSEIAQISDFYGDIQSSRGYLENQLFNNPTETESVISPSPRSSQLPQVSLLSKSVDTELSITSNHIISKNSNVDLSVISPQVSPINPLKDLSYSESKSEKVVNNHSPNFNSNIGGFESLPVSNQKRLQDHRNPSDFSLLEPEKVQESFFSNAKANFAEDSSNQNHKSPSRSSSDSLLLSETDRIKYINSRTESKNHGLQLNNISSPTNIIPKADKNSDQVTTVNDFSEKESDHLIVPPRPPITKISSKDKPLIDIRSNEDNYLISPLNKKDIPKYEIKSTTSYDPNHSTNNDNLSNNMKSRQIQESTGSQKNPSVPEYEKFSMDFDFIDTFDKGDLSADFSKFSLNKASIQNEDFSDPSSSLKKLSNNARSSDLKTHDGDANFTLSSERVLETKEPNDIPLNQEQPFIKNAQKNKLEEIPKDSEDFSESNSSSRVLNGRRHLLSTRFSKVHSTYFPSDSIVEAAPTFEEENIKTKFDFGKEYSNAKTLDPPLQQSTEDLSGDPIDISSGNTQLNIMKNFKNLDLYLNGSPSRLSPPISYPKTNSPAKSFQNVKSGTEIRPKISKLKPDLAFNSIISALIQRVSKSPNSLAYTCIDNKSNEIGNLTWSQVYYRSKKISSILTESPYFIKKGERVALVYRKYEILDYLCSLFGCFINGVVAVPLVSCDSYVELAYVLRSTGTKLVLTSDLNLKSLNKDLEILLPKTSQTNQFDSNTGNNPNDFSSVWPREISWISIDSAIHNLEAPVDIKTQVPKLSEVSKLVESDLAYIEYSKSGNGELKGVSISHGSLIKQCAVWILSTGVPSFKDVPSNVSDKSIIDFDQNSTIKHDSPLSSSFLFQEHGKTKEIHSEKLNSNNSKDEENANYNHGKSFLNRFTSTGGMKLGIKNKKLSVISNNYVKIERPQISPNGKSPANSFNSTNDKINTHKNGISSPANIPGIKSSLKSSRNNHNIAEDLLLDSDSDIDDDDHIDGFGHRNSFSEYDYSHYQKDVILINSEPRQQFGLVFGILSIVLSGNHVIFLSSAVCENPGVYLNTMSRYKANIVVTSGYSTLKKMLNVVIKDPTSILSKKTINGVPDLPSLTNLRLFLVDSLDIDHDFHIKFSSAVLMLFGCPVRKILQEYNRSVLVPILTLPEYGGILLSMSLGDIDHLIDINGEKSNLSNNSMSKLYNKVKNSNNRSMGMYDFDRDVSGIDYVILDREALLHNKISQFSNGNSQNSKGKSIIDSKNSPQNFAKLSLFGPPSLNSSIAIVDPDTRFVCDFNEVGEIWVHTSCSGSGFWGLPKLSHSTFNARFEFYQNMDQVETDYFTNNSRNLKLTKSEKSYLRTGLMGFIVNKKLMVLGYYEDRLRCITKKRVNSTQYMSDISIHYSVEIGYSLKRNFDSIISDCLLMEILSNNVHLVVILIESNFNNNTKYSEVNFSSWASKIGLYLSEQFSLHPFCIAFCGPNTLPRAYQYGNRQINSLLSRRMWELGKVNTFYVKLSFENLYLGLPFELNSNEDIKSKFGPDPSEIIFGKWAQITGYEQLKECPDSQINLDLLQVESITELLVIRAKYFPKELAYVQYNHKGSKICQVSYQELLYKVSFVCIFLLDKLRVKRGDYVLVSIVSSVEYVCVVHACIAIGVIPIPISPILNESQFIEDLPHLVSAINHFKVKSILVNSLLGGGCLLNSKSIQSMLLPLSVVVCDLAKVDQGPKVGFGFGLGIGSSNNNQNSPKNQNMGGKNRVSEFGPVPALVLGQGSFKPYKYLSKENKSIALVMMYGGILLSRPSFVTITNQVIISFCAQQKIDFQMSHNLPIISSVRCYSGYGLLQILALGIFNGCPNIIYPPSDFYINPFLWLSLVSFHKIKDAFATVPMLEHLQFFIESNSSVKDSPHPTHNSGARISMSPIGNSSNGYNRNRLSRTTPSPKTDAINYAKSFGDYHITLENVSNLILANEERVDTQSLNRIRQMLNNYKLGTDCFNPLYGSPLNMCISSRAYLGISQLVLNLDIIAVQHKRVVLLPSTNTDLDDGLLNRQTQFDNDPSKNNNHTGASLSEEIQNSMVLQDSGKVSGSTMVAIVDPESKKIVDVGNIGEIWVFSNCNSLFLEEPSQTSNSNYFQNIEKQNRKSLSSDNSLARRNLLKNMPDGDLSKYDSSISSKKIVFSKLNSDDPSVKDLNFVRTGDYGFLHLDVSNHSIFKGKQIYNAKRSPFQKNPPSDSNFLSSQTHGIHEYNVNPQYPDDNIEKEPFLFVVGKFEESFHHNKMLHFYSDIENTILTCINYETTIIEECVLLQVDYLYDGEFSLHPGKKGGYFYSNSIDPLLNSNDKTQKIVVIVSVGVELQEFFDKFSERVLSRNQQKSSNNLSSNNQQSVLKNLKQNWLTSNNSSNIRTIKSPESFDQDNKIGNMISNIVANILDRHQLKVDQVLVVKKDSIPKKKIKLVGRRQFQILEMFTKKKLEILSNYYT